MTYQPKIKPSIVKPYPGTISNTGRLERVLKLIIYLNEWRSFKELANHIEVSMKSINRYIGLLVRLGFTVERLRNRGWIYRITNTADFFGLAGEVDKTEG